MLLVHYDIKPANVLYTKNTNKFMFADFGISEKIEIEYTKLLSKNELKFSKNLKYSIMENNEPFYDTL